VTAAFAAPPPGRTATAAPHWPLQCRCSGCTAARSRRTATAAQRHCRRRLVGDSPSACGTPCAAAAALPLHSGCHSLPVPASLRGCAAALPPHCLRTSPQSPHRVRTDSAVPPLPRHPVCRRAALPRVPAVPPHCGALES
jgi:hypothetical protein